MPWIIGIDEAGYGPNLGPFVMSAVACRTPGRDGKADLWHSLRDCVRRAEDAEDDRLLIADSKVVYSPAKGLAALEMGALVLMHVASSPRPECLASCVQTVSADSLEELGREVWYVGDSGLPLSADVESITNSGDRFYCSSVRRRLQWAPIHSAVVCPSEFNAISDRLRSKGAVLAHALASLVRRVQSCIADGEPLHFFIDKHGGRNHYAATLQHALQEGMITAGDESAEQSTYSVVGLKRECRFTFEPRADSRHFCVAAASMISKYLRELLMHEFNRYWQSHIPDLKPTAGYPGDADRFFADIRPAIQRLGIAETTLWRRK
jgi:ribonuclease HII